MIVVLNFIFLILIIIIQPYKDKKDWFCGIMTDLGLNIAGIICCILAFMDRNNDFDFEKRMNLGWVFVILNCILIIFILLVYIWQLLKFFWMILKIIVNFYKKRIAKKVESKESIEDISKEIKQENDSKKKVDREKIQRKTMNEKIKQALELNNLFVS